VVYNGISFDEGKRLDSEHANGLEHVLYLSVGSRVNPRCNPKLKVGHVDP